MGESATSLRPLSGAEEFDRRMRSLAQSPAPHSDALAELARLVGQQDPFREAHAAAEAPVKPEAPLASEADFSAFDHDEPPAAVEAVPEAAPDTAPRLPGMDEGWERPGTAWRYPTLVPRRDEPAEPSPDAWAEKAGDAADEAPAVPPVTPPAEASPPAEGGHAKRTLAVLAAVVALTGGGLAASFLAKPTPSASVASASATPTIMASAGPNKVQPETTATGPDAPTEPSTLLDKNNNDGTAAAKVVNTIEQPVDLSQAVKPAPVAADASAQAEAAPAEPTAAPAAGGFPEPRKVKTVLVRPDGSVIAAATTTAKADAEPQSLLDPATAIPIVRRDPPPVPAPAAAAPVVPAPATAASEPAAPPVPAPKTTNRATAPKPAATTAQNATAAAQARTPVATPKAKPVAAHAPAAAKPATPPKPEAVADATPTDTVPTASTGGTFAVQLGAAPTEAEGHEAAKRLAQKYGLSGTPAVIKAQAGGKTVYRIRLGRLSGEDAKALCAKVQSGGGGCFIAHN